MTQRWHNPGYQGHTIQRFVALLRQASFRKKKYCTKTCTLETTIGRDTAMDHHDIDESLDMDAEHSCIMEDAFETSLAVPASPANQLERYGKWLSSIPRDDVIVLRETLEYHDFMRAFEKLGQAHRRVLSMNRGSVPMEESSTEQLHVHQVLPPDPHSMISNHFLQYLTADDVILRIFEFLECNSLSRMALTCTRFRQLAYRSASQRTYDVSNSRQLNSVMQLLRAKEQIDGVGNGVRDSHVRVPILLLERRILVQGAGDPEMNGVYSCTSCNGNGFVFTKPRFPDLSLQHRNGDRLVPQQPPVPHENGQGDAVRMDFDQVVGQDNLGPVPMNQGSGARLESELVQPGQRLRCIIAKRFSNETILWYMSKEISETEARNTTQDEVHHRLEGGERTQVFSFWSKLMGIGDASPDICRYPSQSSILADTGESWQPLSTNHTLQAPIVELLD